MVRAMNVRHNRHQRRQEQIRAHLPYLKPYVGEIGAAKKPRQQPEREQGNDSGS